ncbi:hypothetical protein GGS21DRAFT_217059 [Xylaria nigripes]|nr:hypothetical protein GGS21DRAFT_217059 [Xylaria nigripes]
MVTRGLVFVASRVLDAEKTSDKLYNRFYNEEHLPHVLSGGWTKLALRYKNVEKGAIIPYIALYPRDDTSTTDSTATLNINEEMKKSRILGCDDICDLIHFELRLYEKLQTYEAREHENDSGEHQSRTIYCVAMEPAEGQDEDFGAWYQNQQLDKLGIPKKFRRCIHYRRINGECPRFLSLYEYDCAPGDFPTEQLTQAWGTGRGQKIVNEAKVYQLDVFALIQAQGDLRSKL